MLHLCGISQPQDQRAHLSKFDPTQATWVVSDLRTKFDLQRELIAESGFLHGESILRASELWKILLSRMRPDLQVISPEFAVTLLSQEIGVRAQKIETSGRAVPDWLRAPGAPQTAYHYLSQLMPILSHPEGLELVQDWFSKNEGKNESGRVRWGHWLELSNELWRLFKNEGFVALPWVSGILVNEIGFENVWQRPLVFDLGAEFNQVESDLINLLSRFTDVTVLAPEPTWKSEYGKTLFAYELLDKKLPQKRTSAQKNILSVQALGEKKPPRVFKKFTTMIAEVKDAVATTRAWLESGVSRSQIALVAADIEPYWPALREYLRLEGITVQKDVVARLHSFPDLAQWMAVLRLRSGQIAESDLEISLFSGPQNLNEETILPYDRFRVLFSVIYDNDDLDRDPKIKELYQANIKSTEFIDRDQFVSWSLKSLGESFDEQKVEILFKRLFQECPSSTKLTLAHWLEYLQKVISKVEFRVEEGDPEGVACLNLMSAENSVATHMILLGLTDGALKQSLETGILFGDTLALSSGPGFHLAAGDQNKLEFEARWIFEDTMRVLHLYVPETDFEGSTQAPSWIWMKEQAVVLGSVETHRSVPASTRWDELQRSPWATIAKERNWNAKRAELVSKSMDQDLGLIAPDHFAQKEVFSLSASTIENYLDCPFIFAAKKLFRLSDDPNLDLDVDASTRGSLMHALFARLTESPMRFEYSEEELTQIIQEARDKSGTELADERLWPPLQVRYKEMAKRFLAFEKEWRTRFPETQTVGRELSFQGAIATDGSFHRDPSATSIEFRGRIDRVDKDHTGNLALIDYKSSESNLRQYGSWLGNNEVQLLLYAMAIRDGLTALEPGEIVEAIYLVERTMSRETGLKVEDIEQRLFTIDKKSARNHTNSIARDGLFAETREILRQTVTRMKAGEFYPKPVDVALCDRCKWRIVCRAPHLI